MKKLKTKYIVLFAAISALLGLSLSPCIGQETEEEEGNFLFVIKNVSNSPYVRDYETHPNYENGELVYDIVGKHTVQSGETYEERLSLELFTQSILNDFPEIEVDEDDQDPVMRELGISYLKRVSDLKAGKAVKGPLEFDVHTEFFSATSKFCTPEICDMADTEYPERDGFLETLVMRHQEKPEGHETYDEIEEGDFVLRFKDDL